MGRIKARSTTAPSHHFTDAPNQMYLLADALFQGNLLYRDGFGALPAPSTAPLCGLRVVQQSSEMYYF